PGQVFRAPFCGLGVATTAKPRGPRGGHRGGFSVWVSPPGGGHLIPAGGDKPTRLWDCPPRSPAGTLRGHLSEVQGLAMSPKGRTLASACKDGSIYLWDLDRPTAHSAHQTLPIAVASAVFTPDSRSLVVATHGGGITQFDSQSLRRTR